MPPLNRYLWFIPLLLALAFGLRRSSSQPPSDFAGYYYGGRALIHGQYADAYDMAKLNDRILADGYTDVLVSYAPFPPFSSLIFAPFFGWKMPAAKLIFNLFSIAVFLISLARLTRFLSTPPYLVLALPVVFFIPLLNNLAFGQSYLLLFALLTEGYLAYRKDRIILSSLLWAAAILFKLTPAFLFIFLLLRRQYRSAAFLALACAALLLPSLWVNGFAAWKFYATTVVPRMNHGELNDSFTYVFQSAYMLLKKAFQFDQLLNPHPLLDNAWLFTGFMALFKAAILSIAAVLTLRDKDDFYPFTVWIAACLLISPNGSSYSLVLLILPLLGLAHRITLQTSRNRTFSMDILAAALLLAAASTLSVGRFGAFPLWAQFPRLYLLLLFFALLWWQQRRSWNPALFSVLSLLFFALDIRGNLPPKENSIYALEKEEHLYICDYTTRDNRLVYYWRDDKGRHEQPAGIPISSLSNDSVTLKDNQIWYKGRQLTVTSDQKAKPSLVNGEYILYLSDEHRGFDFYTLRKFLLVAKPPDSATIPAVSR